MPDEINGDSVVVHYGDEVVTLEMRLARQDQQIVWMRRVVIGLAAVMVFHVLLPGQDMLSFILNLLGF